MQVPILTQNKDPNYDDIQTIPESVCYFLMIGLNIFLFVKVIVNFKKSRRVKQKCCDADLSISKCVNSNVMIGVIIRLTLYSLAEVIYYGNFYEKSQTSVKYDKCYKTINKIYMVLQVIDCFYVAFLMIIVSKTWITVWLMTKENINQVKLKVTKATYTLIWLALLSYNIIVILLNLHNKQGVQENDKDNPITSKSMHILTTIEISISTTLLVLSLGILYKKIRDMYEVSTQIIKKKINVGIWSVGICCLIRISLNILLFASTENFTADPIVSPFIIIGLQFCGDFVPNYFFAYMFSPNMSKQNNCSQDDMQDKSPLQQSSKLLSDFSLEEEEYP